MRDGQAIGSLVPGTRFGRYEVVRLIGTGGMGHVYEAILTDLHKRVALKVMLADESGNADERRARFVREGRAAARVRHPNVVEIFDVGVHDDVPFLSMEFLEGSDLRASFQQGPVAPDVLLESILPVMAGVIAAHQAGVVHRDLKPENIFISVDANGDSRPMVLDFGISKLLDNLGQPNMTATATVMGTPLYMSPEQARGSKDIDARTDQYAIGTILYEGLSGKRPFNESSLYTLMLEKMHGHVPRVSKHVPELAGPLCDAVARAMSVAPEERFRDLKEFGATLLPFANERTRLLYGSSFGARAVVAHRSRVPSAEAPDPIPSKRATESVAGTVAGIDAAPGIDSTMRASAHELLVQQPPPSRRTPLLAASGGFLALLTVFMLVRGMQAPAPTAAAARPPHAPSSTPRPAPEPKTFSLQLAITPDNALVEVDSVPTADPLQTLVFARDGKPHTLRVSAPGYAAQSVAFSEDKLPGAINLSPLTAEQTPPPAAAQVLVEPTPTVAQPRKPRVAAAGVEPAQRPNQGAKAPARVTSNNSPILY